MAKYAAKKMTMTIGGKTFPVTDTTPKKNLAGRKIGFGTVKSASFTFCARMLAQWHAQQSATPTAQLVKDPAKAWVNRYFMELYR